MKTETFLHWLLKLLPVALLAAYLAQAWTYANSQQSVLDEGAYLLKGLLFVEGQYRPYQDYGPWTNHMPFSFLIPGLVQATFGPGLYTARLFAIILGAAFVVVLWFGVRRLAGTNWASAAAAAIVFNPAVIKIFSVATSQGLVALMVLAILVLAIGKDRSTRELVAAAMLAGLLIMTRINLAPVLPLLVLYVFWQHGSRTGTLVLLSGGLTVILAHAFFWPGILRMWAAWLPKSLTPFLTSFRPPPTIPFWNPEVDPANRVISLFHGFRFHFVALVGTIFVWIMAPKDSGAQGSLDKKTYYFLSLVFCVLLFTHAWVSLTRSYCVFCFPVYLSFFSFTGILLIVLTYRQWPLRVSWFGQLAGFSLFLLLCTGIAFSAFDQIGDPLLTIQVPRLRNLRILPGSVDLWVLLANRFGWSYQTLLRGVPAAAGFLTGLSVVLGFLLYRLLRRSEAGTAAPFRGFVSGILVAGMLLSPTGLLGGGFKTYDCGANVIDAYETAGHQLAAAIPGGSAVYWQGTLSAVPLLYLDGVEIFPAQINQDYSFRLSGDPDGISRFGLWNETLGRAWVQESDFLIVSVRYFDGWLREAIETDAGLTRVLTTQPLESCNPETVLLLYRRSP